MATLYSTLVSVTLTYRRAHFCRYRPRLCFCNLYPWDVGHGRACERVRHMQMSAVCTLLHILMGGASQRCEQLAKSCISSSRAEKSCNTKPLHANHARKHHGGQDIPSNKVGSYQAATISSHRVLFCHDDVLRWCCLGSAQ